MVAIFQGYGINLSGVREVFPIFLEFVIPFRGTGIFVFCSLNYPRARVTPLHVVHRGGLPRANRALLYHRWAPGVGLELGLRSLGALRLRCFALAVAVTRDEIPMLTGEGRLCFFRAPPLSLSHRSPVLVRVGQLTDRLSSSR